jgi:hypothetical protein
MIRLKSLMEVEGQPAEEQPGAVPAQQPPVAPPASGQPSSAEYSPGFDFNEFESKLAQATEAAKTNFQNKLLQKVNGKKVIIRASKGQPGQPLKDYTINVSGVSVDYYYDKYAVIFKDEKDKEYFLNTMMKIKIVGAAEVSAEKTKKPVTQAPPVPVAPVDKVPNTATQGI